MPSRWLGVLRGRVHQWMTVAGAVAMLIAVKDPRNLYRKDARKGQHDGYYQALDR